MKLPKLEAGDFWGGLAAMLVAVPSAIAFGVTIYSTLGTSYAAQGAIAGILGATALGLIAPACGGTKRLITAPCAPAAAVLAAFALDYVQRGGALAGAVLLLSLLGLAAGIIQILFGTVRLGRLIVYMPYPVVSGYLSGVGLYIIAGQVPRFLGVSKDVHFWESLAGFRHWQWQGIVVGVVTIAVMLVAPRVTKRVPAAILGLLAGVAAYFALGLADPGLFSLTGNDLVVGALGSGSVSFSDALAARWHAIDAIGLAQVKLIAIPALTLAVLLSIDTLKTCIVLDALTRSRHNSNRELIGQGLGNIASAVLGGMPGSGTMGATLVNMSSGAQSSYSGIVEGILSLAAFLVLGSLISWVPVAALAAILMVIGVRMIDLHSFMFLKQRSTVLDFAVIAAVVVTALTVSLIAASGVGILLALVLFIRERIGETIVRRKFLGNEIFSKRVRTRNEMDILVKNGNRTVVVELQSSLFFGTANQLYTALEQDIKLRDFVILDMRRVQTVDVTAAHTLDLIKDILGERNSFLIFSQLPHDLPSGRDMEQFFDQVGLVRPESPVRVFAELDQALEWVEERILIDACNEIDDRKPLEIGEIDLFHGRRPEVLAALEQLMEKRSYKKGEKIFASGDVGDELFLIRRGEVRIMLPINEKLSHHLGTFGRGGFFGEMAFLDGAARSADAIAFTDTDLYLLSRKTFELFAPVHPQSSLAVMEGLASVLSARLRYTNAELRILES